MRDERMIRLIHKRVPELLKYDNETLIKTIANAAHDIKTLEVDVIIGTIINQSRLVGEGLTLDSIKAKMPKWFKEESAKYGLPDW